MKENLDEVSEKHLLFVFSFYEKENKNKKTKHEKNEFPRHLPSHN